MGWGREGRGETSVLFQKQTSSSHLTDKVAIKGPGELVKKRLRPHLVN